MEGSLDHWPQHATWGFSKIFISSGATVGHFYVIGWASRQQRNFCIYRVSHEMLNQTNDIIFKAVVVFFKLQNLIFKKNKCIACCMQHAMHFGSHVRIFRANTRETGSARSVHLRSPKRTLLGEAKNGGKNLLSWKFTNSQKVPKSTKISE